MIKYTTVFIAALIGVIPAIGIAGVLLRKNKKGIGVKLLSITFFWGVLTAIPASVFQIVNMNGTGGNFFVSAFQQLIFFQSSYFMTQTVAPLLFVAIIEELSKGVGVILALRSFSKSKRASLLKINPGLLAGVIVGLAFGVTENGVYFANNFSSQTGSGMAQIIIFRFILSTSAHIIYTGFFGAFLVDAMVVKGIMNKILKIFLAFAIPVVIHTVFNVLVSGENGRLSVPLVVFGIGLLIFKAFWPGEKRSVS
jgi:RsiW-degrading membrane proteinase PrsW (M82 family)